MRNGSLFSCAKSAVDQVPKQRAVREDALGIVTARPPRGGAKISA